MYTWASMRASTHLNAIKNTPELALSKDSFHEYLVPDCFSEPSLTTEERITRITAFEKGYWLQTMRDTLLQEGVPVETVSQVTGKVFESGIPKYVRDNIDKYPTVYGGLCYLVTKQI